MFREKRPDFVLKKRSELKPGEYYRGQNSSVVFMKIYNYWFTDCNGRYAKAVCVKPGLNERGKRIRLHELVYFSDPEAEVIMMEKIDD